jgi:CheY-like chemotaxis protein
VPAAAIKQLVLSIEDNIVDGALLARAFKRSCLSTRLFSVSDGQQAIDYLTGRGIYADREAYPFPTVILLDLKLPRISGFEMLLWIRRQPEFGEVKIVILTGSMDPSDQAKSTDFGANDYLLKPPLFADLKKLVQDIHSRWIAESCPGVTMCAA